MIITRVYEGRCFGLCIGPAIVNSKEECFVVRIHDCRPDGLIKAHALMQYLQEAAACHAEELGAGFGDLDRQGCFWVLANLCVELDCMPKWGDRIFVTTWPSGCTRATASREFIGRLPDGRELFRASSDWMVLDKRTGRPKNLDRLDLNLPQVGRKVLPTALVRLQPSDGYGKVGALRVPFSALDFNGHVNNTEYVRWAFDAMHQSLGALPELRSIQLTYLAEVFEGDEVELLVSARDASIGVCVRESRGGGKNAMVMEVACRERGPGE